MKQFFSFFTYLLQNDYKQTLPAIFLSVVIFGLLAFVHQDYPLPLYGIICFCALFGFLNCYAITQIITEDFTDGTFDLILGQSFNIFKYYFLRLFSLFLCFTLPYFIFTILFFLLLNLNFEFLIPFLLIYIQTLFGIVSLQITLNQTSHFANKMLSLFLFLPFWIPSFLYFLESTQSISSQDALLGLMLFQLGISLILIQISSKWRI